MHKYKLLIAVATVLLLPGCLKSTFREEEPRLEVDREETVLRARSGGGFVKDTLYVSSNRSWTVRPAGDVNWLSFGTEGFENPAEVNKTAMLVIICQDNPGDEERSADLVIIGGGLQKTVRVRQECVRKVGVIDNNGIDNYHFEDYGTTK